MERELVLQGGSRGWQGVENCCKFPSNRSCLGHFDGGRRGNLLLSLSLCYFKKPLASRPLSYKTRQDILFILPDRTTLWARDKWGCLKCFSGVYRLMFADFVIWRYSCWVLLKWPYFSNPNFWGFAFKTYVNRDNNVSLTAYHRV